MTKQRLLSLIDSIKKCLNLSLAGIIGRLISAYAIVAACNLIKYDTLGVSVEGIGQVNILFSFIGILGLTLVFSLVFIKAKTQLPDRLALFFSVNFFLCIASFVHRGQVYTFLVFAIIEAVLCFFCFGAQIKALSPHTAVVRTSFAVMAVFSALMIGVLTALRYKAYIAPNFDFGIFAHMFRNMKESGLPFTTCERGSLLSHFSVHLSPIYYLILPLYMIFTSPVTLNVAQALIVASGLLPLYLLCKQLKLGDAAAIALGFVYIIHPAVSGGCFYDIHENCFLLPLLLWLFYAAERENIVLMLLCTALICFVKEDAPVYVLFFALYLILGRRRLLHGGVLMLFSAAYFAFALWFLKKYGEGAMFYRYDNYSVAGGSMLSVFRAVIASPSYVFSQFFSEDKIKYSLQMLLPFAFLPLINKRVSQYILVGPFVLINLMSNYAYQHSIDFQYNFGVLAFLFYLTILNLREIDSVGIKRALALLCACVSLLGFLFFSANRFAYISIYTDLRQQYDAMDEALLTQVPKDESVAANTFLLPHLCDRDEIYELSSSLEAPLEARAKYLVFDVRFEEFIRSRDRYLLSDNGYKLIYCDSNICVLEYLNYGKRLADG